MRVQIIHDQNNRFRLWEVGVDQVANNAVGESQSLCDVTSL